MHENDESMAIIHSTIELCQRLGLTRTAEGLEIAAQMRTPMSLHCDLGRGYHRFRPMSDLRTGRFLSEGRPKPPIR